MQKNQYSPDELSNKHQVVDNATIQIVGVVINFITGMVLTGMLSRYLGIKGYGELTLSLVYFGFAGIIANFGYAAILVRELSKLKDWHSTAFNSLVSSTLVLTMASSILAVTGLGCYLFFQPYTVLFKIQIMLMSCSYFVLIFNVFESVLKAKLQVKYTVYASVINRLLHLGIMILCLWFKVSFTIIVCTYLISNAVYAVLNFYYSRRFMRFRFIWNLSQIWFLLKASAPLGLSSCLWIFHNRVNIFILERTSGIDAVGIYNAAGKFIDYSYMLSGILMTSLFPLMASRYPDDLTGLRRIYQKNIDYLAIIGGGLSVGLMVFAPALILLIFGPAFKPAIGVLCVLSLLPFMTFLNNMFGYAFLVLGLQGKPLIFGRLLGIVINLALSFFFIPRYSYYGAAIAWVATDFCLMIYAPIVIGFKLQTLSSFRNAAIILICLILCLLMLTCHMPAVATSALAILMFSGAVVFMCRYDKRELWATFFIRFKKFSDSNYPAKR